MAKVWGVAQVRVRSLAILSSRYLLSDGGWLDGSLLVDGAPLRLFRTEAEAEAAADAVVATRGLLAVPVELGVDQAGAVVVSKRPS